MYSCQFLRSYMVQSYQHDQIRAGRLFRSLYSLLFCSPIPVYTSPLPTTSIPVSKSLSSFRILMSYLRHLTSAVYRLFLSGRLSSSRELVVARYASSAVHMNLRRRCGQEINGHNIMVPWLAMSPCPAAAPSMRHQLHAAELVSSNLVMGAFLPSSSMEGHRSFSTSPAPPDVTSVDHQQTDKDVEDLRKNS